MPPCRRDSPALLVFIRGRWQSVPPGSGFAVARRGRLEQLRSGTVRSALRRFQMWLPSKARLGPRLSFKKIPPSDRENSNNDVTLIESKQITLQNVEVRPCKRTRVALSSDEPMQSVTTVATIHATKQRKTSKNHQLQTIRLLSSESKSSEESRTHLKQLSKEILVKSPKKITETSRTDLSKNKSKVIMESPKKSSVSSRMLLDSPKRSLSLRRKPVEVTNSSKESSPILKSKDLSEKQISRYLQPKSGKLNSPKKRETVLSDSDFETDQSELKSKMKQKHRGKKINSISNSEFVKLSSNNHKFHKIGPKRQKLDQDTSESQSSKRSENIFQKPNETYQTQNTKIGTCKELEIEERDIELLRIFIQKHYSDKELLKFDADDEYKRMIFFRINPLVDIEWCPIIDRMLRRSQDSQITLTDFASNLGLRSVTDAASTKAQRYKIRKRTGKSYVDSDSDSSSEIKEDNDKMHRKKENTKILKEREHNMRDSNTGENKAKESKNKESNKRVLTRKRDESESEESNTKENNRKMESTKKRMTRTNHKSVISDSEMNNKAKERAKPESRNTAESDSEANNSKKYNKKAGITKKPTTKANYITVGSESGESNTKENNAKADKAKERAKPENCNTTESDSEASNTKENNKKASNTKKQTKSEVRNKVNIDSEASNAIKHNKKDINANKKTKTEEFKSGKSNSRESNAKRVDRKEIDTTADTIQLSSESENDDAVKAIKKTAKPKSVISSKRRRANLEYSSLEDHAIVAWVSTGSRASRVNGNLLWRQLQDQYTQITGCRRTWHSLRNRYLRYILPKLGNLSLPLSQQTRLRAAAATGEIKSLKMRSPRRNLFKLPPRGAASRRPAAADDDTGTEDKEVPSKRSPSYSSLTRQFNRRHNLTRPSSEMSDKSERSNKLEIKRKESEGKGQSPKKPIKAINLPRKQTNHKTSGNEDSDSDRKSESPRRDIDSSDSSSESEDESTKTNEPRITRRSVNDANKRISRGDTRQTTNESKRKLTRQSIILDEPDESKSRKSRDVTNKRMSAREKTNESPSSNLNRHKSPSEQTSRDSSKSMSQSRRKSPDNNRRSSRRHTKNRDESDDESNRRNSPIRSISRSPMRKLNRNQSPSKTSSKGSNSSMSKLRRKSKSPVKHKKTGHDSSEESDSSNGSVIQTRRKSNRINSPKDRSNRRRSNRLVSPMKQNGRLSSDSPIRKSNRLTPNESSNKRRHSSESKRKSKLAKRDSLDEIVVSDSSESFETKKPERDLKKNVEKPKRKVEKQIMRRLFNPKAIL